MNRPVRTRRTIVRRVIVRWALAALVVLAGAGHAAAQQIDLSEASAREEFRFGVQAYHATRFNDAIVAFNRALAFTPEDLRVREWLGRAYFRTGLEEAAVDEWTIVADRQGAGAYLLSRLDTIRYRRGVQPFLDEDLVLSRSQVLTGQRGETRLFQRPAGIAADGRGDLFLVSLGTQEVLQITPNGRIRRRLGGGLEGLDKPFDVAYHDGRIFVTEYGGDRVAELNSAGNKVLVFGGTGLAPGSLLGPQYVAVDENGFVYVSEWGNRRVSKYGPDGAFLLTIGDASPLFSGLRRPTGVAARGGRVYVADVDDEGVALHVFDDSGNHLRRDPLPLTEEDGVGSLSGNVVEDINWYDQRRLLIAAGERVLLFDPANQEVEAVIDDAERRRVSSAVRDANGRVVVTDFDADQVGFFEPQGALYSGLDVRIERIIARTFPQVAVQVAVHDRDGRPIVGLVAENFIVSEEGVPRAEVALEASGNVVERLETTVLVQPRLGEAYAADAGRAVGDLATLLSAEDRLTVFLAGDQTVPVVEAPATTERIERRVSDAVLNAPDLFRRDQVRLDDGIRQAAGTLFQAGLRRNVVLVGDGRVGDGAFDAYGVQETASYMENNGIRFHIVTVENRTPDAELSFLVQETGGTVRYLYEPEGLAPLVDSLRSAPSGRYWLTLDAGQDPDFGRRYIELSVEARLFVRSGRDELGFFAPRSP